MPSEGLVDLPIYIKGVGLSGLGFSFGCLPMVEDFNFSTTYCISILEYTIDGNDTY